MIEQALLRAKAHKLTDAPPERARAPPGIQRRSTLVKRSWKPLLQAEVGAEEAILLRSMQPNIAAPFT